MLVIYAVLRNVKKPKPKLHRYCFGLPESVANIELPIFTYFKETLKPFISAVLELITLYNE